ncbi:MAG: RDD family protein [Proteobacteria bacterium]|nr:RDD family protein [Pseudomonadota bacterium]MBU1709707.1 RDD family protein [Pseudomonadota bacterium]
MISKHKANIITQGHCPAKFSARAMAFLIDTFLLLGLGAGFAFFTAILLFLFCLDHPELIILLPFFLLIALISLPALMAMYFITLHAFGGQTVGKIIMGLRVVNGKGKPITLGESFLRLSGYLISLLPLAAGFLWAAIDRNKNAWHDSLSGTRVIQYN